MRKRLELLGAGISISVVSHLQMALVAKLLGDLEAHCQGSHFELLLTLNLEEDLLFDPGDFSYRIKIVRNAVPIGFGANHNRAFSHATGKYFCVLNPDIRLSNNPFPALLSGLNDSSAGVVAPLVLNEIGAVEDSARRFPSPLTILMKLFGRSPGSDYAIRDLPISVDWVGGMFMLFSCDVFERLKGFDERYFLYYEDVDICARLELLGQHALISPLAIVVHRAQRASHRHFRYWRWHLTSMFRFFLSSVYWRVRFGL